MTSSLYRPMLSDPIQRNGCGDNGRRIREPSMVDDCDLQGSSSSSSSTTTTSGLWLMLAMAPMHEVLETFLNGQRPDVQVQDLFAEALDKAWNDKYGPSKSYLKKLAKRFIARIGEDNLQSESLLAMMVQMLSHGASPIPDPEEHCYLSFRLPPDDDTDHNQQLLRLRIYPHHNDVSLRLWEAGVVLAEYIYSHPQLVRDQQVVELGAGVGLTGFISMACGATRVTCTDYTDRALENIKYNYSIQTSKAIGERGASFEALHLDWNDVDSDLVAMNPGLEAVAQATILLAADVMYDSAVIPNLVRVLRHFLYSQSAMETPKTVLFAATLRNQSSLELLKNELTACRISTAVLASGQDCEGLPRLFSTKFVQPRSDVTIYLLQRRAE